MSSFASVVNQFKAAVTTGNLDVAERLFADIKATMVNMDSLPPMCFPTPNAEAEQQQAREALEYAVVLAARIQDKASFQRNISALKPYFTLTTTANNTPVTETVLGLHLLYLLVENRLADFHCQLELLSEDSQKSPAVMFCTLLEQHLVVGAYDKVLAAAANPPSQDFSFFLNSLLETVRQNIGECVASAYTTLTIDSATKVLMYQTNDETVEFINYFYPAWHIHGDRIHIHNEQKGPKSELIPSMSLIANTLSYATELERIV